MTTKKKGTKTRPLTFKQVLDIVDTALARGNSTSEKLWDVLTALRGPDTNEYYLKSEITVLIRRKALPKTTKAHMDSGATLADFGYDEPKDAKISSGTVGYEREGYGYKRRGHFRNHAIKAAEALGIYEE